MPPTSNSDLEPLRWHPPACEAGRHCFGQLFDFGVQVRVCNERGAQCRPHISSASRDRFINLRLKRSSDLSLRSARTPWCIHVWTPLCVMRTKGELKVNGEGDEQNERQARRPPPGRAPSEEKTEAKIWYLAFCIKILPNCGGYTIYSVYAAYPLRDETSLSKAAVSCPGSPRAGAFLCLEP